MGTDLTTELINAETDSTTGAEPSAPPDPVKAEDYAHTYTFKEWAATESGNVKTYTPTFNETAKTYTIKWLDVYLDANCPLDTAQYTPATDASEPQTSATPKTMDDNNFYSFDNPVVWTSATNGLVITKTPNFTTIPRKTRTVTWNGGRGETTYHTVTDKETSLGTYPDITLDYSQITNALPTKAKTEFVSYTFVQSANWADDWDSPIETTDANGNLFVSYTPKFVTIQSYNL